MIYTLLLPDDSLLAFDVVSDFTESYSANVNSYETQVGFPVTDNMVLNNPEYSFSAILSYYNSPTREIVLVDGEFQVTDSQEKDVESQVELEQKVRVLWEKKIPFSIIKSTNLYDVIGTELERFDNCLLSNLQLPQSSGVSGAIFPKLTVSKVRMTKVLEEDVVNAVPNLVAKSQVATQQDVKTAEDSKDVSPDGGKPEETAGTTGIKERTGDPETQSRVRQLQTDQQNLTNTRNTLEKVVQKNAESGGDKFYKYEYQDGQPFSQEVGRGAGSGVPFQNR